MGIGVKTSESCLIYALRQSGAVPESVLADLSSRVLTQFLTLRQVVSKSKDAPGLLEMFHIPATVRAWHDGKSSSHCTSAKGPRNCLQLWRGHFLLGSYADIVWLQQLLDEGKLRVRCVKDSPRRRIKIQSFMPRPSILRFV
jgi:hypothetical protein